MYLMFFYSSMLFIFFKNC